MRPRSSGALRQQLRFSSQKSSQSSKNAAGEDNNSQIAYYLGAGVIFVFGLSYASVPLYKVFCQMTGFGGTTQRATESQAAKVKPIDGGKILTVDFVASTNHSMPWKFEPTQKCVKVVPGETALAFYTVRNPCNYPITGVATYNVFPPRAGIYFNKIQCFCFEEQRLGAHEEIDMPVFFFVDPAYADDPYLTSQDKLTLSYTFFKTGDEEVEEIERRVRKAAKAKAQKEKEEKEEKEGKKKEDEEE
jgi:cytochrome c oxidase assembly protein subunit 11